MESLLRDLSADLRERLEIKLRYSNRMLSSLMAEHVKRIEIDGVHQRVFSDVFPLLSSHCVLRDLSSVSSFSPKSLLRVHPPGDFCLVAPVMQCGESVAYDRLMSLMLESNVDLHLCVWMKDGFSVCSG